MKNGDFWDVTPRSCCKSRRFGGTNLAIYRRYFIRDNENTLAAGSLAPNR
jgi:hypothetical protein